MRPRSSSNSVRLTSFVVVVVVGVVVSGAVSSSALSVRGGGGGEVFAVVDVGSAWCPLPLVPPWRVSMAAARSVERWQRGGKRAGCGRDAKKGAALRCSILSAMSRMPVAGV